MKYRKKNNKVFFFRRTFFQLTNHESNIGDFLFLYPKFYSEAKTNKQTNKQTTLAIWNRRWLINNNRFWNNYFIYIPRYAQHLCKTFHRHLPLQVTLLLCHCPFGRHLCSSYRTWSEHLMCIFRPTAMASDLWRSSVVSWELTGTPQSETYTQRRGNQK